jgi:hypothetical protein
MGYYRVTTNIKSVCGGTTATRDGTITIFVGSVLEVASITAV